MVRLVVLGTGTGVGKTTFSVALLQALRRAQPSAVLAGLKPVETGIVAGALTDAAALEQASQGAEPPRPHPLFSYPDAVSPHLAARTAGLAPATPTAVAEWLGNYERALHATSRGAWLLIETAGAVFSPLSPIATNFDLLLALDPCVCLLVAPDSLGTLHDTLITLEALARRGRQPDYVVLSAARLDASTGSNANEMRLLGIANPSAVLDRGGRGLDDFARQLTRAHS